MLTTLRGYGRVRTGARRGAGVTLVALLASWLPGLSGCDDPGTAGVGPLISTTGARSGGAEQDLTGLLRLTISDDASGSGQTLVTVVDDCATMNTPVTRTHKGWTPDTSRQSMTAIGCPPLDPGLTWAVELLDEPFTLTEDGAATTVQNDQGTLTLERPEG